MEDYITIVVTLSFVVAFIQALLNLISNCRKPAGRLPPGPYPFPIVGDVFQLGNKPHKSLAKLSKTYGPLMSLKLGSRTAVVVTSPEIAKQVLQKHDQALSGRTIPDAVRVFDHDKVSMAFMSAGSRWRTLRKTCKEQLFVTSRLDASQRFRVRKMRELSDHVRECGEKGQTVDIGRAAFITSLNLISNTFFSVDLATYDLSNDSSSLEFKRVVSTMLELTGKPNLTDYFPVLRVMDPQGLRREMERCSRKLFAIFDGILDQRLASSSPAYNDVLESLLELTKKSDAELCSNDIKHLLMDLFVAGTESTSSTVEWAMAELLRNPEKLAKARSELQEVLGKEGFIQESDISRMPYLQATVKETLRLHPPGPFLIPHRAETDVQVSGFMVPKNAQIIVNVWAFSRDSSTWSCPNSFAPERFFEREIDYKGQDFEFIPFGAGRRICPGLPLAHRMVHLILATLLHSFDWKLEEGMKPEDIDMDDRFGLTLVKAIPLKAIPI